MAIPSPVATHETSLEPKWKSLIVLLASQQTPRDQASLTRLTTIRTALASRMASQLARLFLALPRLLLVDTSSPLSSTRESMWL
jgi:hypothetical protein